MQTVTIDCFFSEGKKYSSEYAIVAIDVIRATTTAITAISLGRKCFPASSLEMALEISHKLKNPLLGGELGGNMPFGFDIQNSPSQLEKRFDIERPLILLSTSGTKLIQYYTDNHNVYLGCLRNYKALMIHLSRHHNKIALIGAGTREEFREEDQICCALIADGLIKNGFVPENSGTIEIINKWQNTAFDKISEGKSAEYLRKSGQEEDLKYILNHINDLNKVYKYAEGEIIEF